MTQDKETLREAVARAIDACDPDRIDHALCLRQADAAIATMFERLRTPSLVARLEAVYERCKLWPEQSQDGMMALLELRNMVHTEILPILRNPQAMLAAFQKENSDA